jgi:hypothetical protein
MPGPVSTTYFAIFMKVVFMAPRLENYKRKRKEKKRKEKERINKIK